MKIDTQEMKQLAATEAPRLDMYSTIHKAVRAMMADALLAVGRMDCADELEVAQTAHRVLELLDFCRSHLAHENEFVHTAIEARAPGGSDQIAHEHVEHERHIAGLAVLVSQLQAAAAPQKPAAAQLLYRELSLFVAGNFVHMNVEETAHNAMLWAHYTDAELQQIHDALVASIPPAEMMLTARWMVPFMNPAERAGLLAGIRQVAPAPAFQAILDTVQPHLTRQEWVKLAKDLALG